jgi:hypothetical protein
MVTNHRIAVSIIDAVSERLFNGFLFLFCYLTTVKNRFLNLSA